MLDLASQLGLDSLGIAVGSGRTGEDAPSVDVTPPATVPATTPAADQAEAR